MTMQPPRASRDPKMIGLWKVGRTLGKGFSGHVRIARHSKTGQYAAIKIISKGSLGSRVSLNRLADEMEHNLLAVEREIVVMKLIDHPNVMKLYDVWETSSSLYLILEYVQGGELFEYLCNEGRRPVDEALDYFQQIICAVDYCHRFNIAHRDLKLENILIDQHSNVKVADFGMATWQDSSQGRLLQTSCGSPHYAAPEVISGKPYDGPMADIWSCGIILYALLAAKLPFDDDDCPALLQKISIGKFDMPTDISPQAQDLLSRMLTTDVKKRLSMPDIMRHPFFLSRPLKNPDAMPSDLNIDSIAEPIGSLSAIDPDIFANLRTLWHGTQDSELVDSLMSSERNWQKGVYRLLCNYRKKYLEDRREEEALQMREDRKKGKRAQKAKFTESDNPPRASPPTPRRARGHQPKGSTSTTATSFVYVDRHALETPAISLSGPSPQAPTRNMVYSSSYEVGDLSELAAPELEDERIQIFFQQVANHLNVLQARTASFGSPQPDSPTLPPITPIPLILDLPTDTSMPLSSPLGARAANTSVNTSSPFGDLPLGQSSTKPLSVHPKTRIPRPAGARQAKDKENTIPITESDIVNRKSPLLQTAIGIVENSQIPVLKTPSDNRKPSKLRKKRLSSNPPVSPLFSEAGSSFSTPSSTGTSPGGAPRRTWLEGVFKFKPTSYRLLSQFDVHTTRTECRRLLTEMDLLVSLEESEKLGVLKCRSQDVKDPSGIVKSVKFRVELQWPTPQLCHDGFLVSLVLIQEKGSLEVFKGIYKELARTWTLGAAEKSSNINSGETSSNEIAA